MPLPSVKKRSKRPVMSVDLLRRHARVERCDYDDGNLDCWKQVDRHTCHHGYANHGNDQAHHDDEEGIPNSKAGHYCVPPASLVPSSNFINLGSTSCPAWNESKLATMTRSPSAMPASTSTRFGSSNPV